MEDHKPDHFRRCGMFSCGLVRDFRELPDRLLEHQTHLVVANLVGMQINLREAFGNQIKQTGLSEAIDLRVKLLAEALGSVSVCLPPDPRFSCTNQNGLVSDPANCSTVAPTCRTIRILGFGAPQNSGPFACNPSTAIVNSGSASPWSTGIKRRWIWFVA
jgi:hypothetical protein